MNVCSSYRLFFGWIMPGKWHQDTIAAGLDNSLTLVFLFQVEMNSWSSVVIAVLALSFTIQKCKYHDCSYRVVESGPTESVWPGGTFQVWWWQGPPRCSLSVHWHCHATQWTYVIIFMLRMCLHVKFKKVSHHMYPLFARELLFVSFVNAFFGSQLSPLCCYLSRVLMSLLFPCVMPHSIGFLMSACSYSFDFNNPSY